MAEYRTRIKIIGDILDTVRDDIEGEQGASVTYLIKKTSVPHPRLTKILRMLVTQGLMEMDRTGGPGKYRISQSGREFLQAYHTFTDFASDFGLNI